MSQNDALATAAHLHVLLRRKTGRVTDTEWMASNIEYAQAMIRFAREKAAADGHEELLPLADRLEMLVMPPRKAPAPPPPPEVTPAATPAVPLAAVPAANDVNTRYIGRLR